MKEIIKELIYAFIGKIFIDNIVKFIGIQSFDFHSLITKFKLINIKTIKTFDVFFKYYFLALPYILTAIGFLGYKVHPNPLVATFFLIISLLSAWHFHNLNKKQIQKLAH